MKNYSEEELGRMWFWWHEILEETEQLEIISKAWEKTNKEVYYGV